VGAVVAVIWGWGIAQYPDILPGTLSLAAAAAPEGSLGSLIVVFVVAGGLIAPSLALLFWLTQANRLEGHALDPKPEQPGSDGDHGPGGTA
jgi:cytochrome d ubiquinol oxidase subunit II